MNEQALGPKPSTRIRIPSARSVGNRMLAFAFCFLATISFAQPSKPAKGLNAAQRDSAAEHEWWKNAVIYEVYPRSFQDTDGDGIGDLNGIIKRLDYLQHLGVDAIWLTPIYPSANVDFGYDVSDYFNVNREYGTLADFDRLMSEANKRHIRVIMDMVMNHTSSEHSWFITSRSSRDNPYRNWYVWRDGQGETDTDKGRPPNNWGGFGRSSWEWDEKTRQYFYHRYSVQQPDLNWYNPAVKQMFENILGFWLKRGVAGYRFDAIGDLFEDPDFRDEAIAKDKDGKPVLDARGNPVLERTKRFDLPAVHVVMREMHAYIHQFDSTSFPNSRVLIGETLTRTVDELAKWYGTAEQPEFDLPMDTEVGFVNKLDVPTFRKRLVDAETALGNHVPLLVFDNHDRPRLDARYGDGVHDVAIQRALATVLFASGGSTLMYYGDEIGMKTTPPRRREDVKDRMGGVANWPAMRGRDGERTPMQWDSSENAGFSTGTPWLPVPPSAKEINVEAQEHDPNSLLEWYRALIKLKKGTPALALGSNVMLDTSNDNVLSWSRRTPGAATVLVSVNFRANKQTVNLGREVRSAKDSLHTLLRSPGGANPRSIDEIVLEPFGIFIGEIE